MKPRLRPTPAGWTVCIWEGGAWRVYEYGGTWRRAWENFERRGFVYVG